MFWHSYVISAEINIVIRSLEEELGVWDNATDDSQTDKESEEQNGWISPEARRHNMPVVKCK